MSAVNSPKNTEDHNTSLKILQAHSQPNLISGKKNTCLNSSELNSSEWDMKGANDSFVEMENMVAKLCLSPRNNGKTEELNNTLEVIEYILNNPPSGATKELHEEVIYKRLENENHLVKTESDAIQSSPQKIYNGIIKKDIHNSPEPPQNTPVKTANKSHKHTEGYTTPMDIKHRPIFKTPAHPLSSKKPSATSLKKTPSRLNAYQHISSPVASYIKNCPIAPLMKDVHPKKPLPGPSSIPKMVKNPASAKPSNKENVNLPSVAYKSAKKTRVVSTQSFMNSNTIPTIILYYFYGVNSKKCIHIKNIILLTNHFLFLFIQHNIFFVFFFFRLICQMNRSCHRVTGQRK